MIHDDKHGRLWQRRPYGWRYYRDEYVPVIIHGGEVVDGEGVTAVRVAPDRWVETQLWRRIS